MVFNLNAYEEIIVIHIGQYSTLTATPLMFYSEFSDGYTFFIKKAKIYKLLKIGAVISLSLLGVLLLKRYYARKH